MYADFNQMYSGKSSKQFSVLEVGQKKYGNECRNQLLFLFTGKFYGFFIWLIKLPFPDYICKQ